MNAQEVKVIKGKANAIWTQMEKTIGNLFSRWQDEKAHEDIADYAAPLKPIIEKNGGEFVKMTKRPFGVICKIDGVLIQITVKATGEYRWFAVKA